MEETATAKNAAVMVVLIDARTSLSIAVSDNSVKDVARISLIRGATTNNTSVDPSIANVRVNHGIFLEFNLLNLSICIDLYIAKNISYGFAKNFFRFSGRFS